MSQTSTSVPSARNIRTVSAPLTPQPTTAVDAAPARQSVSAAITAAAAVRSAVTAAASSTASSCPVSAFESRTRPVTVGSPFAGLPGNDVTHFNSAWPPPSAGMARKSPAG